MHKFLTIFIVALAAAAGFAQAPSATPHLGTVAMIDLPGRPGFGDVAVVNHLIVATQSDANTIDIFDPQKRRLVAQITNLARPRPIAVDAKNDRFYVGTANSAIAVVSSQDWQVKDTFHVQGSPDVLALSPDGLRLYVGDKTSSAVQAVDTSLRKPIASVELSGRPEDIAIGDQNRLYIAIQDQATIAVLNPDLKLVSQFKLQASMPAGMVYDASSHRLYVAVRAAVLAIDAENGTELARVPAPRGVQTLSFDPASHTLFAAGGGSVIAVNTASGLTGLDELLADVKGHLVVYDPSRKLLFLPGGREGRSKMLIVKDLTPAAPQALPNAEAELH